MDRHRSLKILVVDDEPLIVDLFVEMLGQDHSVVAATTVTGALELLGQDQFDVLVTDWNLPGTDGLWFTGLLAAKGGRSHVLLVTGSEEQPREIPAGIRLTVHRKPVRWKALLDDLTTIGQELEIP